MATVGGATADGRFSLPATGPANRLGTRG